jgi:hypothetical protein
LHPQPTKDFVIAFLGLAVSCWYSLACKESIENNTFGLLIALGVTQ